MTSKDSKKKTGITTERKEGKMITLRIGNNALIAMGVLVITVVIGTLFFSMDFDPRASTAHETLEPAAVEPEVLIQILDDPTCPTCETAQVLEVLRNRFLLDLNVEEIELDSAEGSAFKEAYQIQAVPAYVFSANVRDSAGFAELEEFLMAMDGTYLLRPNAAQPGLYLNPPEVGDDPVKGDANAPVTLIEYSDFECAFCAQFSRDVLTQIEKEYVDTGKVRIVFKDFPITTIHVNAQQAAVAANCADEQGKFWAYHDVLFANQADLSTDALKQYAADLKLDTQAFETCLESGKYESAIQEDLREGISYGSTGTPHVMVNGYALRGTQPYAVVSGLIDRVLAE